MGITIINKNNIIGINHYLSLTYDNNGNHFITETDPLFNYSDYVDGKEYFTCKNFLTEITDVKKWNIDLNVFYRPNSLIISHKPIFIFGNCLQLYFLGYNENGRKKYKIIIPKQFLQNKEDSIIYITGLKYIKYNLNWLFIYFEEIEDSNYYNPNNVINEYISSKTDYTHISYHVNINGDLKFLKNPNSHISNFTFTDIEFFENNPDIITNTEYEYNVTTHYSSLQKVTVESPTKRIIYRALW